MSRSLTTLTAGLLLGTTLTLAQADDPKPPWYSLIWNVGHTAQQCLPADHFNSPEAHLRLVTIQDWPHKMVDIEEAGIVVQTTLIRYASWRGEHQERTWYRGKARCEAAKRAEAQRAREYEQTIQRKYR